MITSRFGLARELAEVRAEIARLQQRERELAALEAGAHPTAVIRQGWPMQRVTRGDPAHA